MAVRMTQGMVNKAREQQPAGSQLYDAEAKGLRLVIGKRSCSWKYLGRINDGSGRYMTIVIGRSDEVSLRSARDRASELRLTLRKGEDPRSPKGSIPSVEAAIDRYLATRPELSARTQEWYSQMVDGPLSHLKSVPVDKIDREACRSLHEKLTRKNGAYMANGALRVLKLIHNDVARTHDLPPNPVSRGVRFNKEKARDWAVSPEEMSNLWQALDAMEDRVRRACWLTILLTGLRSRDARSIRWENLDDDGVLFVPSPKGGEDKAFHLPLPRLLLQALDEVRELNKPLNSPFVFPAPSKTGYFSELRRRKEFPYSPHQLRHSFRNRAIEAGVGFETVTLLMNHAAPHVSFNYITREHLLGPMREAIEKIADKVVSYR